MQFDTINVLHILKLIPLSLALLIVSNLLLIIGFVTGKIVLYKNEKGISTVCPAKMARNLLINQTEAL